MSTFWSIDQLFYDAMNNACYLIYQVCNQTLQQISTYSTS